MNGIIATYSWPEDEAPASPSQPTDGRNSGRPVTFRKSRRDPASGRSRYGPRAVGTDCAEGKTAQAGIHCRRMARQ